MMDHSLFIIGCIICLIVLVILMVGIGSFAKGGEFHRRNSNRIMRYRVAAQAVAVIVIVLFAWLTRR